MVERELRGVKRKLCAKADKPAHAHTRTRARARTHAHTRTHLFENVMQVIWLERCGIGETASSPVALMLKNKGTCFLHGAEGINVLLASEPVLRCTQGQIDTCDVVLAVPFRVSACCCHTDTAAAAAAVASRLPLATLLPASAFVCCLSRLLIRRGPNVCLQLQEGIVERFLQHFQLLCCRNFPARGRSRVLSHHIHCSVCVCVLGERERERVCVCVCVCVCV